jgi:hypothetical protein
LLPPGRRFLLEARDRALRPGTQGEHKVSRFRTEDLPDTPDRRSALSAIGDYRSARARMDESLGKSRNVPFRARRGAGSMNKTILARDGDREWFPPLDQVLDEPEGLLAAGGDRRCPGSGAIVAGFSWYPPANRCCGGRRIRVKCFCPPNSAARAARQNTEMGALE